MSSLLLAESMFLSSFTVILIMLIRKIFQKHVTPKWQYNLWFILLVALTVPLLPKHILDFVGGFAPHEKQMNSLQSQVSSTSSSTIDEGNWMNDFSLSVQRGDLTLLNDLITIIWIIGLLIMIAFTFRAWIELRQIKKSIYIVSDQAILALFKQCKQQLHISQELVLAQSPLIQSPMTFGLFKTYIILPSQAQASLSKEEWKYILLHELNHYKSKDIATNFIIVLFQILYWFNPFVWIAFKEMRLDREIACDRAVLTMLEKDDYAAYGNTIINFADKTYLTRHFGIVTPFSSSKKQLKKRINRIASFTNESKLIKWKSIFVFIIAMGMVMSQIPIVSGMAYNEERFHFESKYTVYEDLQAYFKGSEGSFVLYDLRKAEYSIYNKEKSTLRVSPNSTYKIYNALFALDSGMINSQDTTMKWDGSTYPYKAWNKNQNLFSAMKNSVTWYFQRLDKQLKMERIQAYLKRMNYGNENVSGGIDDYWLESSLKISPIEQVQILKNFYTNQFGFDKKHVQLVKDTMKLESNGNATLYGKTGTGKVNGKNVSGWFIGYVETNNNTYFFATNMTEGQHTNGSTAAQITKSILKDKGIY